MGCERYRRWRLQSCQGPLQRHELDRGGQMSIQFTAFAFPATGAPTPRTLPARLAEIHNVRDFGAVGNGSADDLDAIMAALNWQTANNYRGTVYFPPGTYYV